MTSRLPSVAKASATTTPARGARNASARWTPSRSSSVGSGGSSIGLIARTRSHSAWIWCGIVGVTVLM